MADMGRCEHCNLSEAVYIYTHIRGFPRWYSGKNLPVNAGDVRDTGLIPGSGRYPVEGNGNPLQYSCLRNAMDRGAWRTVDHWIAKSGTRLSIPARVLKNLK